MAGKNKSNELKLTRVYDAPVEAVWDAWVDPKKTALWWGPRGFTITTHSKDLRPGGHWDYTMHGPDGVDYPNTTVYFEVEKNAKLVYDHGGHKDRPPLFRVTVTFKELKGPRTKMEMTMEFATPEVAEQSRKFIKAAGGNGTWDRLAEYLEHESSGKEKFVVNRSFEAPLETVFEMWTKPEHFAKWLPPTGFTMEFLKVDIRPGGASFYKMSGNGVQMYGRAEYREIRRPDRIVYTQQFCDEKGAVSRHPFAPLWPETMLTTVELVDEGEGSTRVTVTWEPFGDVKPGELNEFVRQRGGMTQGWTGSFDKLEEVLARG